MYLRVVPHVARFEVEPGRVELVGVRKVRHAHPKVPEFVHRSRAYSKYQHGFLLSPQPGKKMRGVWSFAPGLNL